MNSYPINEEKAYEQFLVSIVVLLGKLTAKELLPAFRSAQLEFEKEIRIDAWPQTIEAAISRIRLGVRAHLKAARRVVLKTGGEVREGSARELARQLTGVNSLRREGWLSSLLESWAKENSRLISSISEQYLDRVAQRTHDMVRSGTGLDAYRKELGRTYDLTEARARLIARTEVAKLNGQITKARQTRLGIDEYEWLTSADERVRQTHLVLHGKICKWSDPTVYRDASSNEWKSRASIGAYIGAPGSDFQCRCVANALVEEFLDQLLGKAA